MFATVFFNRGLSVIAASLFLHDVYFARVHFYFLQFFIFLYLPKLSASLFFSNSDGRFYCNHCITSAMLYPD